MMNVNLTFSFFLVLLFIITPLPLHAQVINNICPKTSNPPFCSNILKSAHTTDLKGLASYTLNLVSANVGKTLSLAKSLAVKTSNPQLKNRYSSCAENYDEAIGDVQLAQKYLVTGDYNGVNVATSGVMDQVEDCQDNFNGPPTDTSPLLNNGKVLDDICSVVLVISNLLPRAI